MTSLNRIKASQQVCFSRVVWVVVAGCQQNSFLTNADSTRDITIQLTHNVLILLLVSVGIGNTNKQLHIYFTKSQECRCEIMCLKLRSETSHHPRNSKKGMQGKATFHIVNTCNDVSSRHEKSASEIWWNTQFFVRTKACNSTFRPCWGT